jgi:hypothetical protein
MNKLRSGIRHEDYSYDDYAESNDRQFSPGVARPSVLAVSPVSTNLVFFEPGDWEYADWVEQPLTDAVHVFLRSGCRQTSSPSR